MAGGKDAQSEQDFIKKFISENTDIRPINCSVSFNWSSALRFLNPVAVLVVFETLVKVIIISSFFVVREDSLVFFILLGTFLFACYRLLRYWAVSAVFGVNLWTVTTPRGKVVDFFEMQKDSEGKVSNKALKAYLASQAVSAVVFLILCFESVLKSRNWPITCVYIVILYYTYKMFALVNSLLSEPDRQFPTQADQKRNHSDDLKRVILDDSQL